MSIYELELEQSISIQSPAKISKLEWRSGSECTCLGCLGCGSSLPVAEKNPTKQNYVLSKSNHKRYGTFSNTNSIQYFPKLMLTVNNHVNAMCVYGNVYVRMHGSKLIVPMQRLTPETVKMPLSDET